MKKLNLGKYNLIGYGAMLLAFLLDFYVTLPALNIHSNGFWSHILVYLVLGAVFSLPIGKKHWPVDFRFKKMSVLTKIWAVLVGICIFVLLFGNILSSPLFHSKKYASLIQVETSNFEEDIRESEDISDIALMDTASAQIIGERAIGSLADVVSQYVVSDEYTTFDYNGRPMKIATLEYADWFKWFNNRKEGIPGYVLVDPVTNEAKYVELETPIKYTKSGHFGDKLERHLRYQYPTAIFEGYYLELDNEGKPYYICPTMTAKIGIFGAQDVKGVVICDPTNGDCQYYDVKDVPGWVDRVYDGTLVQKKYDWYGMYSGGFFNSIIGNKGCKVTTDDYGYKVMNGDVWIYTGVTSINGDESNIGFVLINLRTCECKYYEIAGAEEYSAMSSAEGQVQHLGYTAAFPSLINIDGSPTYIMVLKDNAGLVKMYAMVNVQKYNIVATGSTQKEVLSEYKRLLKDNGIISKDQFATENMPSKKITIADIKFITADGETVVYIKDTENRVYKQNFSENESLILLNVGDIITVYYEESDGDIKELLSYK
ncbi:MAG: hypothetical protein IKJ15_01695 [Lachnospiraceae bacterium]|nr:hypothetical protein [Lachnospiraceae bacterium]